MDNQLWNLFRETGDPMGYLLYRAELCNKSEKKTKPGAETKKEKPPQGAEF